MSRTILSRMKIKDRRQFINLLLEYLDKGRQLVNNYLGYLFIYLVFYKILSFKFRF